MFHFCATSLACTSDHEEPADGSRCNASRRRSSSSRCHLGTERSPSASRLRTSSSAKYARSSAGNASTVARSSSATVVISQAYRSFRRNVMSSIGLRRPGWVRPPESASGVGIRALVRRSSLARACHSYGSPSSMGSQSCRTRLFSIQRATFCMNVHTSSSPGFI